MKVHSILLVAALAAGCGSPASSDAGSVIPGANPADVHLSLKERGFDVERLAGPMGISWTCTEHTASVALRVDLAGPEASQLAQARASVMAIGENTADAGQDFLAFVASLPYTDARPAEAHEWVLTNFDQDGAAVTIGSARFTLAAPSAKARILLVEPAQ